MFLSLPTRKKITKVEKKNAHSRASRLPKIEPDRIPSLTMILIPIIATTMATIVGREMCSLRNIRAKTAVISGDALIVNKALATVVLLSAMIKVGFASPSDMAPPIPAQPT